LILLMNRSTKFRSLEVLVVRDGLRTRAARWKDRLRADFRNRGAKVVGVKALISKQILE
jgi:hypothetical protein